MRVQKIIQANPDIFKIDQYKNYSDIEAILKISSVECKGNKTQKEDFEIRQTYTAICNLIELGFHSSAIELAIDLIPKAELAQKYKIAQDLCDILILHFYQSDDVKSVDLYKALYDKFTLNISFEHNSMLLYERAIHNHKKNVTIDTEDVNNLIASLKEKLPFDSLWYHYYYYQCKSMILKGADLEQLYLEAISYFQSLHLNHATLVDKFMEGLVGFHLDKKDLEKAEAFINTISTGSLSWYRSYLLFVNILLLENDIKCNDFCLLTMNHENFVELPLPLKEKWRVAYKASVRLLLQNHK